MNRVARINQMDNEMEIRRIMMMVEPPREPVPNEVILAEARARRDDPSPKDAGPAALSLLEAAWSLPPEYRRPMVKLAIEAMIETRAEGLEWASTMVQDTHKEETILFMADAVRQQKAFRGDHVEPMPNKS